MDENITSRVLTRVDPALMRHALALRDRVLLALGEESGSGRALTVTSCHRGEGVTTVAASLAAAFGAPGSWQVLLCDAWGVVVYRQLSDDLGQYVFDDLVAGSYIVGLGTVPGVFQRRDGPSELDCRAGQQYSGVDCGLLAWYVHLPCIMRD